MSISYLINQENSRKAGGEFPPPWQVHALKGFTKIYKMVINIYKKYINGHIYGYINGYIKWTVKC